MLYVIKGLKGEIHNLKSYIKFCKERIEFTAEATTRDKYEKEVKKARKLIQDHRDAINILREFKKAQRQ